MSDSQERVVSSRAIAALVLGILSIFMCLGLMAGIPAILLGSSELKLIKEGLSSNEGESFAKAGFIFGIVGTAFSAAVFLIVLIFFFVSTSTDLAAHLKNLF